MKQVLLDTLSAVGKPPAEWASPDGSTALVLPHGGRILGLFAPGSERNFLWTHKALSSEAFARDYYESKDWHNSGGDRTWLSPEMDFFYPNYPTPNIYFQPREFDPGSYVLRREGHAILLESNFRVRCARSGGSPHVSISKCITPAADPFAGTTAGSGLRYAGYTLTTTLEILDNPSAARLNLWTLLQLPHGGEMIIPTYSRSPVERFMGEIAEGDLKVEDRFVRYRMRQRGEYKIGLPAIALTGRIGYLHHHGEDASLVVRSIQVNASAQYLDTPFSRPSATGSAVQACNVDSGLGQFSELEHHAPAVGGVEKTTSSVDVAQLWAYSGNAARIEELARTLLGSDLVFN